MDNFVLNGIAWEIKAVKPYSPLLEKYDGTFALGICDNDKHIIYVNAELRGRALYLVLCHEITHAFISTYCPELSVRDDELFADLMATYGEEILYFTDRYIKKRD